ncbi:solute carrier family 22 member 8-like isoform X2 [Mizuhopecten yessoensis]|uniref:Solute carrier family 22 member 6-B n=2 Tax=Mizuhopecten yessoensis TaxID=6573 RepID=A0A210PH82_MIZYE|nr:solute carrier family 22 member 8-like isoform X2 [Mizuhopecten yessoensis]XP_021341713.1 solute carrier family 22 member 8-like isoform X2 [Mizuhopecten yessoensis]OWF35842.1 Solute carrier family 22 member 6-B [Mizuhopecten yessoensis]
MLRPVDIDDVWNGLGRFGVYQFQQITLTILATLPMAFHIVSVVFIGFTPEHTCSVELSDVTDNNRINDVINVTADTCNILVQRNVNGNLVTEETGCLYGVNYTLSKTSTFVSEWDLVCERDTIGRLSQSLVLGGMFLGALAAPLADKFGRKPVHVAFNIGLLAVTFTMAFVKNITTFLVLRFFVGTFQQGMLITVVTFWLELFHTDSREDVGIVNGFMWASSVNVLTLVAFLLRDYDWRILQLALSVFSVLSLVEIFMMDESLRWLIANNKMKKCHALIEKVWTLNKRNKQILSEADQKETDMKPLSTEAVGKVILPLRSNSLTDQTTVMVEEHWSQLVTDKILRRHSLITWGLWVANNLTYYGIVMMTPSFAVGRYLGFFLGSISEMVGNFILLFLIKRFTRKTTISIFQFVGSVALLLTIITIHFDGDVVRIVEVVLFAVARGSISNSFNAIYLYTPELFPTNLRSAGLGVASAAGRLSGIIAPFCVYMMEVALWLPSLLFASLCLIFCFLIRYLPETKGRELPQKLEEIWEWYNHDNNRNTIDTNTVDHEVFITTPCQ